MRSFIDVQIAVSVDAAEMGSVLHDQGLLGTWEQDGVIHLYWDESTWNDQLLRQVEQVLVQLGGTLSPSAIGVLKVPSQDWNKAWTESIRPVKIGRRIVVRPSWLTVDLPSNAIELILDPRQAFGTGHHVTTQLLCEWLEDCIQGGERVLDVGTGSGLLAMVALRLGAASALGVDYDSVSIACAKEYAKVNHFDSTLELQAVDIHALSTADSFDILVANIDRRTLLSQHSTLAKLSNPKTNLFMSGILNDDQHDMIATYTAEGWRCIEVRCRDEWIALHFQPQ